MPIGLIPVGASNPVTEELPVKRERGRPPGAKNKKTPSPMEPGVEPIAPSDPGPSAPTPEPVATPVDPADDP